MQLVHERSHFLKYKYILWQSPPNSRQHGRIERHVRMSLKYIRSWNLPVPLPAFYHIGICSYLDWYYQLLKSSLRDRVGALGQSGSVTRRWHGITRQCSGFDTGNLDICQSELCILCRTIRASFDLSTASSGIYTSSTSNQYVYCVTLFIKAYDF